MVTPLEATREDLPPDVTTRITLRLASSDSKEYKRLLEAITDMPDTTILFLRQLPKIRIKITHEDGENELIKIGKIISSSDESVQIVKSQEIDGDKEISRTLYHMFTHIVEDTPIGGLRKHRRETSVTLAFPTDPVDWKPKLSNMGQFLFAYLPLQRLPQLQVKLC